MQASSGPTVDHDRSGGWYSIGEAASLSGMSASGVRLLERARLIQPSRTPGGHRVYSDDDIQRLRRIQHLRQVERMNAAAIRRELGPADGSSPTTVPAVDPALGRRLRALRLARQLPLAAVSGRTGLSISFLSAVERGLAGISLGNLFKLADALGTTVPGLQGGFERRPGRVLRPADRPRYSANHGRVLIEDLITEPGVLEAQRIEIEPGGESEEGYTHQGEELLFVIEGQLTLWIDERERHDLAAGDSLSLRSSLLHRWCNQGETTAVVLWINVPVVESSVDERHGRRAARRR